MRMIMSSSSSSPEITYKNIVLYKTEKCRNWEEKGTCRYGNRCRYAHGEQELRPILRSHQYKTKICKAYHFSGSCPYGVRCTFIHQPNAVDNFHHNLVQGKPATFLHRPKQDTDMFIAKNIMDDINGLSSYSP